MNRWLLAVVMLFAGLEVVACGFLNTFGSAIIVYTLLFTVLFFVVFSVLYWLHSLGADIHPWVSDVERMNCFSQVYWVWLFENRRREWAADMTMLAVGTTIFFGAVLAYGQFSFTDAFIGFSAAIVLLIVTALYWYRGFWKPRTEERKPRVPAEVEAEWRDRKL